MLKYRDLLNHWTNFKDTWIKGREGVKLLGREGVKLLRGY